MQKVITQKYINDLTYKIIGCAIEVQKELGAGLMESLYEKCFVRELYLNGIAYKEQAQIPINYKGLYLQADLRFDVLVENLILVELKAIEAVAPVHEAILLSYMKLLEKPKGILINFNCKNIFKEGQKTFVNEFYKSLPPM